MRRYLTLIVSVVSAPFFLVGRAAAASEQFCTGDGPLGLPTWYKFLRTEFVDEQCNVLFDVHTDIPRVALAIFEILLRLGGIVAVSMVIYGGVQFVLSQGEPDKIKGARTTIINALVGLVLVVSAVTIVNAVGGSL